jgi:hypothetical protein
LTKWIESTGGPLILLEKRLLHFWCGTDGTHQDGRCVAATTTDYDRACAVSSQLGLVALASSKAMVFGDMPRATALWCSSLTEIYIVRVVYIDPKRDLRDFATLFHRNSFVGLPLEFGFEISSGAMVLFDSAFPGSEQLGDQLDLELLPGRYEFRTSQLSPDERTAFIIHAAVRTVS